MAKTLGYSHAVMVSDRIREYPLFNKLSKNLRMMKTIEVITSCDHQFINRVTTLDPFEYWNRCIVPGTHREEFDLDNCLCKKSTPYHHIHIQRNNNPAFNYKITYTQNDQYHSSLQDHNNLVEALIMFFGSNRVTIKE